MDHKLPKSVHQMLRSKRNVAHPSADLLTGYVERSLTAAEREDVFLHLALCDECRETVFLASDAMEFPPVGAPAAPRSLWLQGRRAVLLPVAAVVLIGAAISVYRYDAARTTKHTLVAVSHPPQASPAAEIGQTQDAVSLTKESPTAVPAQKTTANVTSVARDKLSAPVSVADLNKKSLTLAEPSQPVLHDSKSGKATEEMKREMVPALALQATSRPTPSKPETAATPPALPSVQIAGPGGMLPPGTTLSSGVANSASFAAADGASPGVPQAAFRTASPPVWRITPQGAVEHHTVNAGWERVLGDYPQDFRSVAVIGGHVWVGGAGGLLLRSGDGGQTWSKVALASGDRTENATIVSLRFANAQQGTVTTESGAQWTTADGGQTWSKEQKP